MNVGAWMWGSMDVEAWMWRHGCGGMDVGAWMWGAWMWGHGWLNLVYSSIYNGAEYKHEQSLNSITSQDMPSLFFNMSEVSPLSEAS